MDNKSLPLIEKIDDVSIEKSGDGKDLYFTGPFIVMDKRNINGRIYKSSRTIPVVEQHIEEYVKQNKSVGELDHPEDMKEIPKIHLDNVTHRITELTLDKNIFYGKAKIASTPKGLLVKGLYETGIQLGASSRAMGAVDNDFVVKAGMMLVTPADIVYNPSAIEAIMDGIYESADFVKPVFGEAELDEMRTLMKQRRNWIAVNNNITHSLKRG